MLRKLFLVLFFAASSAYADPQATAGQDFVVLHRDACTNPAIVALIGPDMAKQLHAAEATIQGQHFNACWTITSPDLVGVIYEDGDTGVVPVDAFKEKGV